MYIVIVRFKSSPINLSSVVFLEDAPNAKEAMLSARRKIKCSDESIKRIGARPVEECLGAFFIDDHRAQICLKDRNLIPERDFIS